MTKKRLAEITDLVDSGFAEADKKMKEYGKTELFAFVVYGSLKFGPNHGMRFSLGYKRTMTKQKTYKLIYVAGLVPLYKDALKAGTYKTSPHLLETSSKVSAKKHLIKEFSYQAEIIDAMYRRAKK